MTEPSYYRWRSEYGGLKVDQGRRLKDLERENARLKPAVAELTLDKRMLKAAAEGTFQALSAAGLVCGMCRRRSGVRRPGVSHAGPAAIDAAQGSGGAVR